MKDKKGFFEKFTKWQFGWFVSMVIISISMALTFIWPEYSGAFVIKGVLFLVLWVLIFVLVIDDL